MEKIVESKQPTASCFVIVHTVYIIHANNISLRADETTLLTEPVVLCRDSFMCAFSRESFFFPYFLVAYFPSFVC